MVKRLVLAMGMGALLLVVHAPWVLADHTPPVQLQVEVDGYRTDYILPDGLGPFDVAADQQGRMWLVLADSAELGWLEPDAGTLGRVPVPAGMQPVMLAVDDAGAVWFTESELRMDAGPGHVVRYVPESDTFGSVPVPEEGTAPYGILLTDDGSIWFTQVLGDKVGRLVLADEDSLRLQEWNVPGDVEDRRGPVGLAADPDGRVWYVLTYSRELAVFDPDSGDQRIYPFPTGFQAPALVAVGPDGWVWVGEHGGDRLAGFDPDSDTFHIMVTPRTRSDEYPISGVNDAAIDAHGDVWFTEHFIPRMGRLHRDSGTVMEYHLPRTNPLIQHLYVDGANGVWFAEYGTGVVSRVDAAGAPLFPVTLSTDRIQLAPGESGEIGVEVEYLRGGSEDVTVDLYAEERPGLVTTVPPDTVTLRRGERAAAGAITISVREDAAPDTYMLPFGVNGDKFSATATLTVELIPPRRVGLVGLFQDQPALLALAGVVVIGGLGGILLLLRRRTSPAR